MKAKLAITLITATLLCSCGTQIQLIEYVPAQFNLKRGATLQISPNGALSEQVAYFLAQNIKKDDKYYSIVKYNPDYTISIYDVLTPAGMVSQRSVRIQILRRSDFSIILDRVEEENGISFSKGTWGLLADKLYSRFAPHEQKYKERIKTSSENPTLEQAVTACRKHDWTTARQLALSAIQQVPQDPEAYYLMGLLERSESNFPQSDAYFHKACELAPDNSKYKAAIKKNAEMIINEAIVVDQLND